MNRRKFLQTSTAASLAAPLTAQGAPGNPAIEEARQVALKLLQPSQRDLEHGLELHGQSVVFDAYGFSPRAAVDGGRLRAAIEGGASEIELQDLRERMSMTRCVDVDAERSEFQEAWRASGVTCIFQNAGEEGQDPLRLIKRLAHFTYLTDMMPEVVSKAVRPGDVPAAKKEGRHCLYFTGNGVPLTQAWASVEDEMRYIPIFYELGIRMMHITYQRRNMLGDGCGEAANAGLSDFGRAVVKELNRVGVIPDVAHSGWQTSLETARVSGKPMVASHTVCAALNRHARSKPDEVIRAVADTGGYIGICCIPGFLGRTGDIRSLLDHIDYAVKKLGAERVAIGTDVAYVSGNEEGERKKVPRTPRYREQFRLLWPPDSFQTTPEMRKSLAWTNWPLFTVGLVQRGHSDEDIQKIIGGNVLRVLAANIPERGQGV
jgi:membrane dipeptidase